MNKINSFLFCLMLFSSCSIADKIRILGPSESPYVGSPLVFFMIVDENNDLLAVQSAIKSKRPTEMMEGSKGEWKEKNLEGFVTEEINFRQSYITVPANRYPRAVWDYDNVLEEIGKIDPVLTLEGKMIGDKEELSPFIDEDKVEEKNKEDIIIDFDNPEEPIVVVEDERTIQIRELNEELINLQEYLEEIGEDEEAEEEIKLLKEKIEALK